MIVPLLSILAIAASPLPAAISSPSRKAHSLVIGDKQGLRSVELRRGEKIVLTFDANWHPNLVTVKIADPIEVAKRIGQPLDLNMQEAATKAIKVKGAPGSNPRRLNSAVPNTVIMTLVPYGGGTLLLVENGLAVPFRYHAASMTGLATGYMSGQSTTLCPAPPYIGTIESWAKLYDALVITKFEPSAADAQRCIA